MANKGLLMMTPAKLARQVAAAAVFHLELKIADDKSAAAASVIMIMMIIMDFKVL